MTPRLPLRNASAIASGAWKMMEAIGKGVEPAAALKQATSTYGRFAEAVKTINPRHE